ncbi:hypothetical protein AT15_03510 [Kosmotoga arenicorallina S304]|uniref:Polysaccharide export protein n=1 Tax=Kosmotoga arenicorallina S304 TaxID=1453497 RepID=A0A182C815_9BACT|nr:SLBB domain-containing protein [Kosmotoga arenicorallina]OAA31904.1 hypothetical protein AT15_03510 [Kosmotoga arenicorallina S304]
MKRSVLIVTFLVLAVIALAAYQLRTGDTIRIYVYSHEELTVDVSVGPDGWITIPPIGSLKVLGKTLDEVSAELKKSYSNLVTDPKVTVSVQEYAPFIYYILGEVRNPGSVILSTQRASIAQLIAAAGGLEETADERQFQIVKSDGKRIIVDIEGYPEDTKLTNVFLEPGDSLFVLNGYNSWIKVIGEVNNPGIFKYMDGITLTRVIAEAGGVKETGDPEEIAVITRLGNSTQRKIYNLNDIFAGKSSDPLLKEGSSVIVNSVSQKAVKVIGEVRNPGVVPYRKGITLLRAVSDAGGFASTAGKSALVISGKDSSSYDIKSLLEGTVEDPSLIPGSTIVIPKEMEKYVYLLAQDFSGRIDFSTDEKITLRNVLLKTGKYLPDSDEIIEVIAPDGTKTKVPMKELATKDIELSSGALITLTQALNFAYVAGEVSKPGVQYLERYEESTLRNVLIKAGIKTESAGTIEVISNGKKVYSLENALVSEDVVAAGSVIIVNKEPEKYVYLVGEGFEGGKLELTADEPLTLKSVLARLNLLPVIANRSVKVISRTGESTIDTSILEKEDIILEPGVVLNLEGLFTKIYVFGEVQKPGLVLIGPDTIPSIANILSKAGGLLTTAGEIQLIEDGNISTFTLDPVLLTSTVLNNNTVLYVDKQPERFVYFISGKNGGRIDFTEAENPTLRNLLSKLNMLDLESSTSLTLYSPDGNIKEVSMSYLLDKDIPLEYGSIVVDRYTGREIKVLGEVKNPGAFAPNTASDFKLSSAIAAMGGLLETADRNNILLIDPSSDKPVTVDFDSLLSQGKDYPLKPGMTVFVPKMLDKYAYITGEVKVPGIKEFSSEERFTLGALIAKAGGITPDASEVQVISSKGKKVLSLGDAVISSEGLLPGTLVHVVKNLERYVYIVSAEKGGRINFASSEKLTLKTALVKAGLLDYRLEKEIVIQKPDGSQQQIILNSLRNNDVALEPGSVIVYPEPGVSIYVLGAVNSPGKITFEPGEVPTLTKALTLAGGTSIGFSGYISISDDKEIKEVELDSILRGKSADPVLSDYTMLFVQEASDRYVYLISPNTGGRVEFEKNEKMTLKTLLAKKNYLGPKMNGQVVLQYPDGRKMIFDLVELESRDLSLAGGTIVMFPDALRELYVLGAVYNPGVKIFEPSESLNLTSLISKAGGLLETAHESEVYITYPSGKSVTANLKDILEGKSRDIMLESRTLVYVPFFKPVKVNVLGGVNSPSIVEFGPDETPTLLNAIAKAGGIKKNASDTVRLGKGEGSYRWLDLIENVDLPVEDGTVIYVPEDTERYVYVLGQVYKPGRIDFDKYEKITLASVIAKAGGVLSSASDEIKILQNDGRIKTAKLSELENKLDNPEILSGSTIIVNEATTKITILGQVRNPGTYIFGRKDTPTIAAAIARAGGINDINAVESILLYNNGELEELGDFTADKVPIQGEALIYVKPVKELVFTVIGEVRNPGSFIYTSKHYPSLVELLTRAGGIKANAEEVQIIQTDSFEVLSVDEAKRSIEPFKNEVIIIVAGTGRRFISVVGEVKNPGLIDLGQFEKSVNLGEAIAQAGGFVNNSVEYVEVIGPDLKKNILPLNGDNLAKALSFELEAGSTVYVPQNYLKILVLGEVENPGVVSYTTDITLLDAIALCGGFTPDAYKNVLLINYSGDEPEIEYVDLAGNKVSKGALKLDPGDVIYVPQSRYIDIKEVLNFISSVLNITGAGLHLLNPTAY